MAARTPNSALRQQLRALVEHRPEIVIAALIIRPAMRRELVAMLLRQLDMLPGDAPLRALIRGFAHDSDGGVRDLLRDYLTTDEQARAGADAQRKAQTGGPDFDVLER